MNPPTHLAAQLPRFGTIALLLSCVTSAQILRATPPTSALAQDSTRGVDANGVTVISQTVPGARLSTFVGRDVHDRAGQVLGSIKDMYLDAHTGKGVYAAVAGSQNGKLRLVPFAALRGHSSGNGFVVNMAAKEWEQITPASPTDQEATRITLSAADGRQLAQLFGGPAHTAAGAHLIAVRELRGKRVSTGSDHVGTVDDAIVESDRETAAVILLPEKDFSIAGRKFVVPVHQLNLGARDLNPITTALARSHFERAHQRETAR